MTSYAPGSMSSMLSARSVAFERRFVAEGDDVDVVARRSQRGGVAGAVRADGDDGGVGERQRA